MIISRKRFEEEVEKRVNEAVCKFQENVWRNEREREQNRFAGEMEQRIISLEKKNGIDHPSHHRGENAVYPL
jgi:hypothetical protein